MLLRLTCLGVVNAFATLRLLPMSDRDKDAEILALRHQITVLERQLGTGKVRFTPRDRAFPAAPLNRLPCHMPVSADHPTSGFCSSLMAAMVPGRLPRDTDPPP
ncbi:MULTISPECIES: hypothetical protein [Streptomyces]|uniref:hypothetical protein n=1 Tax=Streptomyces TaxID=1883 RepID=UPI0027E50812|nr:hypothetical protein [Streptomyces sp. GbtcB7]